MNNENGTVQSTTLKNGMYFSVHIVKDGHLYSSPLRDLPTLAAGMIEYISYVAATGQEDVDKALKTLNN